jgi:hypothetical protein
MAQMSYSADDDAREHGGCRGREVRVGLRAALGNRKYASLRSFETTLLARQLPRHRASSPARDLQQARERERVDRRDDVGREPSIAASSAR